MRRFKDHLVSRVREIRTHGLNGGLTDTQSLTGDKQDLPMAVQQIDELVKRYQDLAKRAGDLRSYL